MITSFRTSRKHPLLVVVEEPMAEVTANWRRKLGWLLIVDLVGMLMIIAGTVTTWRSLRAHERMAAVLDRTRGRLEESERHLRAVIEAAPAPMFVLDPLGRYVFVGAEDYTVQRFDLKDGKLTPLLGHESWCRAIGFSPDGTTTFPQRMTVDYVRVYAPTNLPSSSAKALVNPGLEPGGPALRLESRL